MGFFICGFIVIFLLVLAGCIVKSVSKHNETSGLLFAMAFVMVVVTLLGTGIASDNNIQTTIESTEEIVLTVYEGYPVIEEENESVAPLNEKNIDDFDVVLFSKDSKDFILTKTIYERDHLWFNFKRFYTIEKLIIPLME